MAKGSTATATDTAPSTAPSTNTEPLFVPVDELPVQAQRTRERKYDSLVDAAFAQPGQWFRINASFKSAGQAAAMRKQYKDELDEAGNVLHVKTAKVDGSVLIYVKADQPADQPSDDAWR